MPLYTLENIKTGEREDVLMSWDSLQTKLKENPDLKSVITKAPGLISATEGFALRKAGDGWKEVQQRIKAAAPRSQRDNIETK